MGRNGSGWGDVGKERGREGRQQIHNEVERTERIITKLMLSILVFNSQIIEGSTYVGYDLWQH